MSSRSRRLLQIYCGCGPHNPAFGQGPQRGIIDLLARPGGCFWCAPSGWTSHLIDRSRLSGTSLKTCLGLTLQAAPAPSFAIIIDESFQGDTNGHDNDPRSESGGYEKGANQPNRQPRAEGQRSQV